MVCFFGRVPGTWYERLVVFFHQILCPLPPPLFRGCVPALWYKCDPIDLYKVATAYAFLALSVVLVLAVVAILLKVFAFKLQEHREAEHRKAFIKTAVELSKIYLERPRTDPKPHVDGVASHSHVAGSKPNSDEVETNTYPAAATTEHVTNRNAMADLDIESDQDLNDDSDKDIDEDYDPTENNEDSEDEIISYAEDAELHGLQIDNSGPSRALNIRVNYAHSGDDVE